jgi:undecaprenyl-diphosphatase
MFWLVASCSFASGFDHVVPFDDHGIWNRNVQLGLEDALIAAEVVGALWLGGEDPVGKTFWQAIDSSALGAVSAQALKYVFMRARPSQTSDPNKWFQGSGHYSFPSGEVTLVTSVVTPFMFEFGPELFTRLRYYLRTTRLRA